MLWDVIFLCLLSRRSWGAGAGALYSQTRGLGILPRWLILILVFFSGRSWCVYGIFEGVLVTSGQFGTNWVDTAHCDWETYRLLAWSLVLVLVPQLHRIAHVSHADAEWRGLCLSYVSASVTALRTTAGADTLPAIGDTRCLVTLLGGGIVRQGGQRKIGRAQARYIAESGRRGGRGGGGLQGSSVDLGIWLWWCWSSCRCCRDLGVSCHGSGKAHASERDRGWPECGSRCGERILFTAVHTLTAHCTPATVGDDDGVGEAIRQQRKQAWPLPAVSLTAGCSCQHCPETANDSLDCLPDFARGRLRTAETQISIRRQSLSWLFVYSTARSMERYTVWFFNTADFHAQRCHKVYTNFLAGRLPATQSISNHGGHLLPPITCYVIPDRK